MCGPGDFELPHGPGHALQEMNDAHQEACCHGMSALLLPWTGRDGGLSGSVGFLPFSFVFLVYGFRLRITGSQGNSCSTRSPSNSPSGSGVALCSSLSRLISCSAGVRVFVFSVTLRRHRKPSSSLCSCWTCRTGDGRPSTLLLWSLTFIPSRLRLSSPVNCSRGGIWDVAPQQQLPPPLGPGPPQPMRTLPGMLTALAASLDRLRSHNAFWTVQEVIAAEARFLESIHNEVGTCTAADDTRLFPQGGTTSAMHTTRYALPTLAHRRPIRGRAKWCTSCRGWLCSGLPPCAGHHTELPWVLRVVCRVFCFGCVFFTLESGGF